LVFYLRKIGSDCGPLQPMLSGDQYSMAQIVSCWNWIQQDII
jgi:hypothetical protein